MISLVVTIIVLIILAGVSLNAVIGENGIITIAKEQKNAMDESARQEANEMAMLQEELNNKLTNEEGIIPIFTSEQLLKIGTGEKVVINGIEYTLEKGKNYVLQNDIEYTGNYDEIADMIKNGEINFNGQSHKIVVTVETGIKEYYTEDSKYYIATNQNGYVVRGLELYYDGIDNTGNGIHSNLATVWKDLSGNGNDGVLHNFGTSAISGWNNTYLSLDGVNDWVNCGVLNYENVTLEATYQFNSNSIEWMAVLGNWQDGGNGLLLAGNTGGGEIYNGSAYHTIDAKDSIDKKKIITHSLTYNGQDEVLYMDGIAKGSETLTGNIEFPQNNTVMAIGVNTIGEDYGSNAGFACMDVYTIRIYSRGLTQEEIEINNKTDEKRFKKKDIIPIYTQEQLLKVGTGEQVNIEQENKTYTFAAGENYELKNNITINADYTSIMNKINNKEVNIVKSDYKIRNGENYYTANSKYTIAVNQYGYVSNGLELLLDGIDNTGNGAHSNTEATWKDLSGNNRDGTLVNMDIANCWEEDGIIFDGADDYVRIAEMNYDAITIETVSTMGESTGSSMNVVSNVEAGGYRLYQNASGRWGFGVYVKENEQYQYAPINKETSKEVGRKYSISGSYDGRKIRLRTSGRSLYQEEVIEGSIGTTTSNTYMLLGANPQGSNAHGEYFNGGISNVRIYSRALTDEENAVNYLNDIDRYHL